MLFALILLSMIISTGEAMILSRILYTLNDQVLLRKIGPLIPASWGVSPRDWSASNTARIIHGNVLFDTGAGHFSIDQAVAQQLGLQPLAKKEDVYGLGGKRSVSIHSATLFLRTETVRPIGQMPEGSLALLPIPVEAHGVDIQAMYESQGIKATNGLPVIGIVGRTFLQFTKFTYDGLSGNVLIEIDESVQRPQKM